MIKNYTRLALIDTGRDGIERYRDYARSLAERWSLRFEEIPGSNALVHQMLFGPWDEDFVVVRQASRSATSTFSRPTRHPHNGE